MFIFSDNVPVGGFCSLYKQCTGSNNSEICENGRCTCAEGFKYVEFACKKSNVNQLFKNNFYFISIAFACLK